MKKAMNGMTIGIIAAVVIAAFIIGYYMAYSGEPAGSAQPQANASSGESGAETTTFQRENLNEVIIQNSAFSPAELRIKAGSKVTWTNLDSTTHSVVSDSGSEGGISSGLLAKGQAYAKVFEQPGVYNYHCGLHSTMRGKIIVE